MIVGNHHLFFGWAVFALWVRFVHSQTDDVSPAVDEEEPLVMAREASQSDMTMFPAYAWTTMSSRGCGGTLVWPDLVLTAAQCAQDSNFLSSQGFWIAGQNADGSHVHAYARGDTYLTNNDPTTHQTDLALIPLSTPTTGIPVQAYNKDPTVPAVAQSLMLTDNDLPHATTLLKAGLANEAHATCGVSESEGPRKICAGRNNSHRSVKGAKKDDKKVCHGDSGGPVLTASGLQVGVVPYGTTACDANTQSKVYSEVSYSAAWIDQTICQHSAVPPKGCKKKKPKGGPKRSTLRGRSQ